MHSVPQLLTIHPIRARVDPLIAMRFLVRPPTPKELFTVERGWGREHRVLPMLEHDPVLRVVLLCAPVAVLAPQEVVAVPRVVVLDAVLCVVQLRAGVPGGAVRELCVVVPLPAVDGVVELGAALPLVAGVAVKVEVDLVPDLAAVVELGAELEGVPYPKPADPVGDEHPPVKLNCLCLGLYLKLLLLLGLILVLIWG